MTEIEKHTRTLDQPGSFMDLAEHVSWMLGETVDGEDYPMEVTVTIEASAGTDRNEEGESNAQ